jgi:hypothetical protein
VLDFVEGEVERGELCEGVEAFDVCDEVVVEVDFGEGWCEDVGYVDSFQSVLSET